MQLDLPIGVGPPIPVLYVQMDGTGVPIVKKETEGRKGKADGQPAHTREAKLGGVFTQPSGNLAFGSGKGQRESLSGGTNARVHAAVPP